MSQAMFTFENGEERESRLAVPLDSVEFRSCGFSTADAKERDLVQLFMESGRIISIRCFVITEEDREDGLEHVDSADYIMGRLKSPVHDLLLIFHVKNIIVS